MFSLLNSDGSNFLECVNDAKTVLTADDLARIITTLVITSTNLAVQIPSACRWQTLLLLRRHLHHSLRLQYLQVNDPTELWTQLHSRFNHQ